MSGCESTDLGSGQCQPTALNVVWGGWGWPGLLFSAEQWWAPVHSEQKRLESATEEKENAIISVDTKDKSPIFVETILCILLFTTLK